MQPPRRPELPSPPGPRRPAGGVRAGCRRPVWLGTTRLSPLGLRARAAVLMCRVRRGAWCVSSVQRRREKTMRA